MKRRCRSYRLDGSIPCSSVFQIVIVAQDDSVECSEIQTTAQLYKIPKQVQTEFMIKSQTYHLSFLISRLPYGLDLQHKDRHLGDIRQGSPPKAQLTRGPATAAARKWSHTEKSKAKDHKGGASRNAIRDAICDAICDTKCGGWSWLST
ncbi:hypothetical protein STEG23_000623 [Scotinomys teguina]